MLTHERDKIRKLVSSEGTNGMSNETKLQANGDSIDMINSSRRDCVCLNAREHSSEQGSERQR